MPGAPQWISLWNARSEIRASALASPGLAFANRIVCSEFMRIGYGSPAIHHDALTVGR